jgi:hypothetical protein
MALWWAGCAGPIAGLWPPPPGAATYRVTVALDGWHSVVGVSPASDPDGSAGDRHIEWGYADRSYYLDGNDGASGSCGALFWPTAGVLRVAPAGRSVIDTAAEPAQRWTFRLSAAGHRRLLAFLEAEKASGDAISHLGESTWYAARHSYQLFHHCNQWTTRALRTAGLPVWPTYSMFRWSFAMQLDRASRFMPPD